MNPNPFLPTVPRKWSLREAVSWPGAHTAFPRVSKGKGNSEPGPASEHHIPLSPIPAPERNTPATWPHGTVHPRPPGVLAPGWQEGASRERSQETSPWWVVLEDKSLAQLLTLELGWLAGSWVFLPWVREGRGSHGGFTPSRGLVDFGEGVALALGPGFMVRRLKPGKSGFLFEQLYRNIIHIPHNLPV